MLHDDYLCLVESGKQQIKEVRRKFKRKTWKQRQLLSESGFVLRIAPPSLSRDRRIKMKKSINLKWLWVSYHWQILRLWRLIIVPWLPKGANGPPLETLVWPRLINLSMLSFSKVVCQSINYFNVFDSATGFKLRATIVRSAMVLLRLIQLYTETLCFDKLSILF